MTDIAAQKAAARMSAFAVRKFAHNSYSGRAATQNLLDFLAPYLGEPMSAYMPIRSEIDTLPAMAQLAKSGPLAVPFIRGNGHPLAFHRWYADAAMKSGPFGVSVPVEVEVVTPRVVIVPLLAFDGRGYRLGYGGGYYDRTLANLRAAGRLLAVGFAYSAQEIEVVPTEPTDQSLDAVVTEIAAKWFGKSAD